MERRLLADLEECLEKRKGRPELLQKPIRVIVSSRSLRDHLAATLVRRIGKPIAGLFIKTLHGLALEILKNACESPPGNGLLREVLAERFAKEDSILSGQLGDLHQGYGAVAATIEDFFDAGFEQAHLPPLEDAITEMATPTLTSAELERARAVVRTAARIAHLMEDLNMGGTPGLFKRARCLLLEDPEKVLPSSALFIHGFNDATGVAADFIECLLRRCGARLYLDHPPDPASPSAPDAGVAFARGFQMRMEAAAAVEKPHEPAVPPPRLTILRASGADTEVREVAWRTLELLEGGTQPESVALVARDMTPYRVTIRRHFSRLGIPFFAPSAAGLIDPKGRSIFSLLALLRLRARTPIEHWLELLDPSGAGETLDVILRPAGRFDTHLALHALGAARLEDVARLREHPVIKRGIDLPIPVRRGIGRADEDPTDWETPAGPPRARRRKLRASDLERAVALAESLLDRWNRWPQAAGLRHHLSLLGALLSDSLGWAIDSDPFREILEWLNSISTKETAAFPLSYEEFVHLASRALEDLARNPLGGRGGGVRILNVMEARGLTFEHLFVLGLNRDRFPRVIREDPLLPDTVRRELKKVLPDLPLKRTGLDEERFLFAQLMSSSPRITLSYQEVGDDGKPLSPSPFLVRLSLSDNAPEPETASLLYALPEQSSAESPRATRTPIEHAVMAGLYGSRSRFSRILIPAVCWARGHLNGGHLQDPSSLAKALVSILEEVDPDLTTPGGRDRYRNLGPFFGFLGPVRSKNDPRLMDLFITTVEAMAACPWRVFLERLLGIETRPDPLEETPALDASLLGTTVHAVLERIVSDALPRGPKRIDQVRDLVPDKVPWPDPRRLARLLDEEAERILLQEGFGLPGLVRLLSALALPYLEVAASVEWPGGGPRSEVFGAELLGSLEVKDQAEAGRRIFFKADSAELAQGRLRLTDYKTGRPISTAKKEETRRRKLLEAARRGEWLQALAYVAAAGHDDAVGRYVFLKPDIEQSARIIELSGDDEDLLRAFRETVQRALLAWDLGAFFPRLVEPDGRGEPRRCRTCAYSQCCLRGDSGARNRLSQWAVGLLNDSEKKSAVQPMEAALLGIWRDGQ